MQSILDQIGKAAYGQCPIQYGSSRGGNLERLFNSARLITIVGADGHGTTVDDLTFYNVSGPEQIDAIEVVYEDDSERALIIRLAPASKPNYFISASSETFASLLMMRV